MKLYYLISGGFDPIHEGHIAMIKDSISRSDGVIILLNSDNWLIRKKGKCFLKFATRKAICENLKGVIDVLEFDDSDESANKGIIMARQKYPDDYLVYANGCDSKIPSDILESDFCRLNNIELAFGIGGDEKLNSSSSILAAWTASTRA